MRRARVWASGLSCVLILCASAARAECTKDIDCEGELVCEANACVDPPPAAAPVALPAPAPVAVPTVAPTARPPAPSYFEPEESEPPPRYKRNSRALMVVGIVAVSLGTVALLASASSSSRTADGERDYGGWVATGLLLGAGIPMIAVGSKMVPNPSASRASVGPWLSPQGGGLRLRLAL